MLTHICQYKGHKVHRKVPKLGNSTLWFLFTRAYLMRANLMGLIINNRDINNLTLLYVLSTV